MKNKKTRAFLIWGGALLVLALLALHLHNPLFTGRAGYWAVGYSSLETVPDQFQVNPQQIFAQKDLAVHVPQTEFLADPFFLYDEGKYYLFFEHKKFGNPHASIGVLTSADGKNYQYGGDVLSQGFHLSYPQVFKHNNRYFMLPEAQGSGHVVLYESDKFPYSWKVADTLIHGLRLKDPSIYLSDTLNIIVGSDADFKMYMYTADSLLGKWNAHKKPVARSGTESRPGGRFFTHEGKLLLPVQNQSKGYGSGVSLYEFRFSADDYQVVRHSEMYLKGQPGIPEFTFGMHHLDLQKTEKGIYCVYDGIPAKEGKNLSYIGSLKMTFYDIMNLFR